MVAGGYWGIYPVVSNIFSVREQIEDEQVLMDENVLKVAQAPLYSADNEQIEADVLKQREVLSKSLQDIRNDIMFEENSKSNEVESLTSDLLLVQSLSK